VEFLRSILEIIVNVSFSLRLLELDGLTECTKRPGEVSSCDRRRTPAIRGIESVNNYAEVILQATAAAVAVVSEGNRTPGEEDAFIAAIGIQRFPR
jgi:hypothetical protein